MRLTRKTILTVVIIVLATGIIWAGGEKETTKAEAAEVKTLNYWHKDDAYFHEWVTAMAKEFMSQNPGIVINIERQTGSWGDYGTKIRMVLRSKKDVPDIIQIHDVDSSMLASAGYFMEAPPRIAKIIDENSLQPTFRKMAHQDGQLEKPVMIVNLFSHWQQLYYNTNQMKEAGLPVRGAKDWVEFRTYAKKLAKHDASGNITRAGFSFRIQDPAWHLGCWVYSAGGSWLSDENSQAQVMTPEGRKAWGDALKFIYDITWTDNAGDFKAGDPRLAFRNGINSISADSTADIARLRRDAPDLDWFIANIPKDKYSATILAVRPVSVYKDAKYPDVAWNFLGYIIKDENLAKVCDVDKVSSLPSYKSTVMLPKFQQQESWKIALQQKNLRARMQGTGATDYYTQAGREIEAYLSKAKSLDAALDSMATEYETITKTRSISEIKVEFDE
jgi:multiple sugar transport system substrate-binding protein